jgi:hypothetical protein
MTTTMTTDNRVAVFVAVRGQRARYIENWLSAREWGVQPDYWAKQIEDVNDAEMALRAVFYGEAR